jgi:hypothetical protein
MHTLTMVAGGLAALAVCVGLAALFQKPLAEGARYFILPWLAASLVNLYLGVTRAGVPLSTELAVLAVVFGVPAAVAWYVSRRLAR